MVRISFWIFVLCCSVFFDLLSASKKPFKLKSFRFSWALGAGDSEKVLTIVYRSLFRLRFPKPKQAETRRSNAVRFHLFQKANKAKPVPLDSLFEHLQSTQFKAACVAWICGEAVADVEVQVQAPVAAVQAQTPQVVAATQAQAPVAGVQGQAPVAAAQAPVLAAAAASPEDIRIQILRLQQELLRRPLSN